MQDTQIEKQIIVVGKRSSKKKYIFILLIILVLLITLLLIYAYENTEKTDGTIKPTLSPTPTLELSVTNTPIVQDITPTPTLTNSDLQKYVYPDCEIDFQANSLWLPSTAGYLGTCGILSTNGLENFTNLTDYEGTLIAILPFLSDSPFAPEKQKNYTEYLEKLPTDSNRYNPTRDFLYSVGDYPLDYKTGKIAEIYNARLGMTNQIFYTGFRGEYIILWGGQTADSLEADVMEIIRTIKFRQTLPGEE